LCCLCIATEHLYRLGLAFTSFTTPSRRLHFVFTSPYLFTSHSSLLTPVAVVGTPGFNNNVVVANPGINNNINGAIIGPNGNAIVDTGPNYYNNPFNNNGK
jgi:hypothetical protein